MVLGSNGESVYLSIEERVEFVERATEMAGKDKLIIAGAGCECKGIPVFPIRSLIFSLKIAIFLT